MDPHELYGRYRELQQYLGWTDADGARVAAAWEQLKPHLPSLVDDFFTEVHRHPNASRVISGGRPQVARLKTTLTVWLGDLFSNQYDRDFVVRRWKVGAKHVDIALEQTYTSAALARLRKGLCRALEATWQHNRAELLGTMESLNMLLDMDLAIIQDAYEDEYKSRARRRERTPEKQSAEQA